MSVYLPPQRPISTAPSSGKSGYGTVGFCCACAFARISESSEKKNGPPSPIGQRQIPLISVITFCRLYPNECQ